MKQFFRTVFAPSLAIILISLWIIWQTQSQHLVPRIPHSPQLSMPMAPMLD